MALPEVFLEPIKTFLTLHDEERSKFVESVLQTAPSIKLDAFSHRVAQAAKMEPDLVKKILSVLAGLYMAIQDGRTSIGAIANQIRVALTASELAPADGNWELFMSDFERLLTAPNPFTTTAKALELFIEHPKAFASCRILTDLRPVFAADPATGPTAFMVFQSFVLG